MKVDLREIFKSALTEKEIGSEEFNELGDPYATEFEQEFEIESKERSEGEGGCVLRTLKDFEIFDGESGEYVSLDDINQLRRTRGTEVDFDFIQTSSIIMTLNELYVYRVKICFNIIM